MYIAGRMKELDERNNARARAVSKTKSGRRINFFCRKISRRRKANNPGMDLRMRLFAILIPFLIKAKKIAATDHIRESGSNQCVTCR